MDKMFKSVEKLVYSQAVHADEYSTDNQWWKIYRQFVQMRRRYYVMKWLIGKFPVLTFGIGLILGLISGSLLKK